MPPSPPFPPPPPATEDELLQRAARLAGATLAELAAQAGQRVPHDLRRHKGWVGQLLERHLGASAGSAPEPDFPQLGIELKSLPLDRRGLPRESTYVCVVPLEGGQTGHWEGSLLQRKLARVLWLPVEADPGLVLAERQVGVALLWSPDAAEQAQLRRDYEELMELVAYGRLEELDARFGEVLQIRPKAAHSRVRGSSVGPDGAPLQVNPRGFYLRPSFTAGLLQRHFQG